MKTELYLKRIAADMKVNVIDLISRVDCQDIVCDEDSTKVIVHLLKSIEELESLLPSA